MGEKTYQKTKTGKKFYDKQGYNRYTEKGKKGTFGSNYRIGIGKKKFSK